MLSYISTNDLYVTDLFLYFCIFFLTVSSRLIDNLHPPFTSRSLHHGWTRGQEILLEEDKNTGGEATSSDVTVSGQAALKDSIIHSKKRKASEAPFDTGSWYYPQVSMPFGRILQVSPKQYILFAEGVLNILTIYIEPTGLTTDSYLWGLKAIARLKGCLRVLMNEALKELGK